MIRCPFWCRSCKTRGLCYNTQTLQPGGDEASFPFVLTWTSADALKYGSIRHPEGLADDAHRAIRTAPCMCPDGKEEVLSAKRSQGITSQVTFLKTHIFGGET